MKYDYKEAVRNDILDYIQSEVDLKDFDSRDELFDSLYDELWLSDSVTGNASGSYTFNAYEAEENLCHNMDLLVEALCEFGYSRFDSGEYIVKNGSEACDVTIRCYLLGECLDEVIDQILDSHKKYKKL